MPIPLCFVPCHTVEGADTVDQPLAFQAFEHTVDRGQREGGHPAPQPFVYDFRRRMSVVPRQQPVDGYSLGRDPDAPIAAQPLEAPAPGFRVSDLCGSRCAVDAPRPWHFCGSDCHLQLITICIRHRQAPRRTNENEPRIRSRTTARKPGEGQEVTDSTDCTDSWPQLEIGLKVR
jgi:hypothetical protein